MEGIIDYSLDKKRRILDDNRTELFIVGTQLIVWVR